MTLPPTLPEADSQADIVLVYDKECPACNAYCQIVRIRESVGNLHIVDARKNTAIRDEITDLKLDIDQGMVLKIKDQIYYGTDAIHALALISTQSGFFNRFNYWLFKSEARAKRLYPLLRNCRNLLLKVLRKTKINNLEIPNNDRF